MGSGLGRTVLLPSWLSVNCGRQWNSFSCVLDNAADTRVSDPSSLRRKARCGSNSRLRPTVRCRSTSLRNQFQDICSWNLLISKSSIVPALGTEQIPNWCFLLAYISLFPQVPLGSDDLWVARINCNCSWNREDAEEHNTDSKVVVAFSGATTVMPLLPGPVGALDEPSSI